MHAHGNQSFHEITSYTETWCAYLGHDLVVSAFWDRFKAHFFQPECFVDASHADFLHGCVILEHVWFSLLFGQTDRNQLR